MKTRQLGVVSIIVVVVTVSLATYVYHETHDNPPEVVLNWQFNNPKYKNERMIHSIFSYDPSNDGGDAYCQFSSGQWLYFRVEKGFLGTWHMENVEEVSFEELPAWVYENINKEPKVLEEWEARHRDELEEMTTYDQYISDGTIYYVKLKDGMWLILEFTKDSSGDWNIEENEIGATPDEIAETLSLWYEDGEITVAEIADFLETLVEDGTDTTSIRDTFKAKGVPLNGDEEEG